MQKKFKSPVKQYVEGNFKRAPRPRSPSPKRKDYAKKSLTKDDGKSKCTYIHPDTGKRCKNMLGVYPEFCELHTMMVNNVYIAKSRIPNAGNGLYAGPYGFKKGDIIGQYNHPWNAVKQGTIEKRCKNKHCWSYVFCDEEDKNNPEHTRCWDGLDVRSTLMRNINDAHNSGLRNNSYFDVIDGNVYVIASRNIRPHGEVLVNYGSSYWK